VGHPTGRGGEVGRIRSGEEGNMGFDNYKNLKLLGGRVDVFR
jgi:hypothetical protein